jgi:hypothetical protein
VTVLTSSTKIRLRSNRRALYAFARIRPADPGRIGYAFELTAWDEQVSGGGGVDKIRMKIWADNQGNGVLYDNQVACPDQADGATPCTVLGGGSIVIHKGK